MPLKNQSIDMLLFTQPFNHSFSEFSLGVLFEWMEVPFVYLFFWLQSKNGNKQNVLNHQSCNAEDFDYSISFSFICGCNLF